MKFRVLGLDERPRLARRHRRQSRLVDHDRQPLGRAGRAAQARLGEHPVDGDGRRAAERRQRQRSGDLADHEGRVPYLRHRREMPRPDRQASPTRSSTEGSSQATSMRNG